MVRECPSIRELIQVTYELNASNYEREIKGLVKTAKRLGVGKLTIVTLEDETQIHERNLTVEVLPIWKFLLREHQS